MDWFSTKIAYAAPSTDLNGFIKNINEYIINPLIVFLFALAIVFFLYGVFEFIMNAGSDEKKTTGKSHMLWGIVGLTIMMGVWFILGVILRTMNISPSEINPEQGTVRLKEYTPPPLR